MAGKNNKANKAPPAPKAKAKQSKAKSANQGLPPLARRGPIATGNKTSTMVYSSEMVQSVRVNEDSEYQLMVFPMSCKDMHKIKVNRTMYQFYEPVKIEITVKSNFSSIAGGGYRIGYLSDPSDIEFNGKDELVRALSSGLKSKVANLSSNCRMVINQQEIRQGTDRTKFFTDASSDVRLSECGNIFLVLTAAPSGGNSSTLEVTMDVQFRFTMPTIVSAKTGRATQSKLPDSLYQIVKQKGLFLEKTLANQAPTLNDVRAIWPLLPADKNAVLKIVGGFTYEYNHGNKDTLSGQYILYDWTGDARGCFFMPIRRNSELQWIIADESVDQIDHYQLALASETPYQIVCENLEELNALTGAPQVIRRMDKFGLRTGDIIVMSQPNIGPDVTTSSIRIDQSQLDTQTEVLRTAVQDATAQTDVLVGELEESMDAAFAASRTHAVEQNALTQAHITEAHVLTRGEAHIEAAAIAAEVAGVAGEVGGVIRNIDILSTNVEVKDLQATAMRANIFNQVDGQSHKEIASLITGKHVDSYDLLLSSLQQMSSEYNTNPESDTFRDSLNAMLSAFQLPEVMPDFDATIAVADLKSHLSSGRLFAYHGSAFPEAVAWPNYHNLGTSQFPIENAVGLFVRTQYNDVIGELPVYTYLQVVSNDDDGNLQFKIVQESRLTRALVDDWALHYSFSTDRITSYKQEKIQVATGTEPRVLDVMLNGSQQ